MYRIRFHGRGGQGMKTASRFLGAAFFIAGFEVQDAPRYGAERRGAPIFAYVRAARRPIHERGVIGHPDLVIVADESLIAVPAAGVLAGADASTVLLINTHESAQTWRNRLNVAGPIVILPASERVVDRAALRFVGAACAGAAARLTGIIARDALMQAVAEELQAFPDEVVGANQWHAGEAFDLLAAQTGIVREGGDVGAREYARPAWIDLPFDAADVAAPVIHAGLTSVQVKTGLWRTMRPVIDLERCHRCWWVCSTLCPDGAICVTADGSPQVDYDHCKGCLVCVAVCPHHAISAIPEHEAQAAAAAEAGA